MTPYEILEVPKSANEREIKSAHRSLLIRWHPDKFSEEDKKREAEQRSELINRAFYCIGDPERKRMYDMYGDEGVGTSAASTSEQGQGIDQSFRRKVNRLVRFGQRVFRDE